MNWRTGPAAVPVQLTARTKHWPWPFLLEISPSQRRVIVSSWSPAWPVTTDSKWRKRSRITPKADILANSSPICLDFFFDPLRGDSWVKPLLRKGLATRMSDGSTSKAHVIKEYENRGIWIVDGIIRQNHSWSYKTTVASQETRTDIIRN
jgi:hypothetical protein